jgi:hypothetical protein
MPAGGRAGRRAGVNCDSDRSDGREQLVKTAMKWLQILNMVAAAYVVAIGAVMLIAMLIEPDTLRDYTGQTVGLISIGGIVLFIVCALYVGLRTVYQAIRALYLRD